MYSSQCEDTSCLRKLVSSPRQWVSLQSSGHLTKDGIASTLGRCATNTDGSFLKPKAGKNGNHVWQPKHKLPRGWNLSGTLVWTRHIVQMPEINGLDFSDGRGKTSVQFFKGKHRKAAYPQTFWMAAFPGLYSIRTVGQNSAQTGPRSGYSAPRNLHGMGNPPPFSGGFLS